MNRARGAAARRAGWSWVWAAATVACATGVNQRSEPDRAIPGVTVEAPCVDGHCEEGLSCQLGARGERCVLEPGRCRDEWDCGRSVQRCRRFGTRLGVCQDSGL